MNKSELIEAVALKADITIGRAEELVDLFFGQVTKTLNEGGRVEIRGFGAFAIKAYGSYVGRNPKTGSKIIVKEKKLPVWRTGLEMKKRVDACWYDAKRAELPTSVAS